MRSGPPAGSPITIQLSSASSSPSRSTVAAAPTPPRGTSRDGAAAARRQGRHLDARRRTPTDVPGGVVEPDVAAGHRSAARGTTTVPCRAHSRERRRCARCRRPRRGRRGAARTRRAAAGRARTGRRPSGSSRRAHRSSGPADHSSRTPRGRGAELETRAPATACQGLEIDGRHRRRPAASGSTGADAQPSAGDTLTRRRRQLLPVAAAAAGPAVDRHLGAGGPDRRRTTVWRTQVWSAASIASGSCDDELARPAPLVVTERLAAPAASAISVDDPARERRQPRQMRSALNDGSWSENVDSNCSSRSAESRRRPSRGWPLAPGVRRRDCRAVGHPVAAALEAVRGQGHPAAGRGPGRSRPSRRPRRGSTARTAW